MERPEYEEYLEFKEFQRMRREKNSRAIGHMATESAKPLLPVKLEPLEMTDNFSHDFDALWYQGRI